MSLSTRRVDAKSRVVLPEQFAGKVVAIDLIGDCEVRIRIARSPRRRPTLAALLGGITEENSHGAVDFGPPSGAEQL